MLGADRKDSYQAYAQLALRARRKSHVAAYTRGVLRQPEFGPEFRGLGFKKELATKLDVEKGPRGMAKVWVGLFFLNPTKIGCAGCGEVKAGRTCAVISREFPEAKLHTKSVVRELLLEGRPRGIRVLCDVLISWAGLHHGGVVLILDFLSSVFFKRLPCKGSDLSVVFPGSQPR